MLMEPFICSILNAESVRVSMIRALPLSNADFASASEIRWASSIGAGGTTADVGVVDVVAGGADDVAEVVGLAVAAVLATFEQPSPKDVSTIKDAKNDVFSFMVISHQTLLKLRQRDSQRLLFQRS